MALYGPQGGWANSRISRARPRYRVPGVWPHEQLGDRLPAGRLEMPRLMPRPMRPASERNERFRCIRVARFTTPPLPG